MRSAVLTLAVVTLAADNSDLTKAEVELLQGKWEVVAGESNGKAWTPALVAALNARMEIKGQSLTLRADNLPTTVRTFALDLERTPYAIDTTVQSKDGKPVTVHGIYEIEGDNLRWAHGVGGKRPTAFKTDGEGIQVWVFRRVKE